MDDVSEGADNPGQFLHWLHSNGFSQPNLKIVQFSTSEGGRGLVATQDIEVIPFPLHSAQAEKNNVCSFVLRRF